MMLAAADFGLGSTWVMSFDPGKIIAEYHIPENLVPVALLVIGYPADDAKPSKSHFERLPIESTAFYNEF
jgi:nitroreductase